jgi:hypothetical protein
LIGLTRINARGDIPFNQQLGVCLQFGVKVVNDGAPLDHPTQA